MIITKSKRSVNEPKTVKKETEKEAIRRFSSFRWLNCKELGGKVRGERRERAESMLN